MAQNLSTLLACDPVIASDSPASAMASIIGDQFISELLRYGRPHLPAHGSDFQSFMNHAVKLAKILTGANGSAIALRGEQGTICRARCGEGAPPLGAPVDTNSGISRQCLDSGTSLRCEDIATDGRVDPEICLAIGIRAVAVVPIYSDGEISGILEVFASTPGIFNDQHLHRLQQLASWIGSAVDTPSEKPICIPNVDIQLPGHPAIALLVGMEPAQRVFFRNPADLVRLRSPAHLVSSNQMHEWNDVLVASHSPWKRFLQSIFLHVVAMGMLSGISRIYPREVIVLPRSIREAHVTYYPIPQSFPAREGSRPAMYPRRPTPPILPAPDIEGAKARQSHLRSFPVVAPPPDLSNGSGVRRLNALKVAVVPPSPEVGSSMARAGRVDNGRLGGGFAGTPEVSIVQPPPSISDHPLLTYGAAGVTSQTRIQVVPPPPLVQSLAKLGAGGNAIVPGGGLSPVVPPPPSLEGGNTIGGGRAHSLGESGSQVVPPPPSMQGEGNYKGTIRISSLAHADSQVVSPPPSVQDGPGRISGAGRRSSSLARAGAEGVLPPSAQPSENFGPDGAKVAKDVGSSSSSAEIRDSRMQSIVQEVQLRVISLAWSPPRSSYFSNFEVFVAEKWLNKEESQFIKLVYVFLPYQSRLSEYRSDPLKIRKLRVTRDPTCDESLMQLTGPEGTGLPSPPHSPHVMGSVPHDSDDVLPCYRTTADDYQRALSRRR